MPYYYLAIFLLLVLMAVPEASGRLTPRAARTLKFIALFALFITAALRYETGVDWRAYQDTFDLQYSFGEIFSTSYDDFFTQFAMEPGYLTLTSLVKWLGGNIQAVFFVAALANIILLNKTLSYYTNRPVLVLMAYYCFVFFILDMSGVRQAVALNILLYGSRHVVERRFWRYLLWTVGAALFHQSALLFLFLYPMLGKKRTNFTLMYVLYLVSLAVMIVKLRWMETVVGMILPIFVPGNLTQKIVTYVFSGNFYDPYVNPVKVLFIFTLLTFGYMQRNTLFASPRDRMILLGAFVFGILNNMLFELSELNGRFSAYMIVFVGIAAAHIVSRYQLAANRAIIGVVVMFYCFFYARVYLVENPATLPYYPYQNYAVHKIFDIPSTGEDRLDEWINSN